MSSTFLSTNDLLGWKQYCLSSFILASEALLKDGVNTGAVVVSDSLAWDHPACNGNSIRVTRIFYSLSYGKTRPALYRVDSTSEILTIFRHTSKDQNHFLLHDLPSNISISAIQLHVQDYTFFIDGEEEKLTFSIFYGFKGR